MFTCVFRGESKHYREDEAEEQQRMDGLGEVLDQAFMLLFPEQQSKVIWQAEERICHHEVYLITSERTLRANSFLFVKMQRVLKCQCFE